ncbi:MAG: TonB-dependent receptor plug domain-containing protein, partial [Maricaulaceae bacterium]
MKFQLKATASALALVMGASGLTGALAQDDEDEDRDVIVVTAEKRAESIQDVPVAITAFSDTQRDEIGITSVQDLTNFVPGLTYTSANDRITLRGVGRQTNNFGTEPGVANYVDGVYSSSTLPGNREPIFIDRIEVVRGPQGTLYGRNSAGGAINIITKRPTEEFEAEVRFIAGNYDRYEQHGTVSGPLSDWARFRIDATNVDIADGYFRNYSGLENEGGRRDRYFIDAQLEFDVGENLELWMIAGTQAYNNKGAPGARTRGSGPIAYCDTVFDCGNPLGPSADFGLLVPSGDIEGSFTANPGALYGDPFAFNSNFTSSANLEYADEARFEAIYHAPSFDVKYLAGGAHYEYHLLDDRFNNTPVNSYDLYWWSAANAPSPFLVGAPLPLALQAAPPAGSGVTTIYPNYILDYTEDRFWYSNEINFISTHDGPLQWLAGIYQYREDYYQPVATTMPNQAELENPVYCAFGGAFGCYLPNAMFNGVAGTGAGFLNTPAPANPLRALNYTEAEGTGDSLGVFTQFDYDFLERWHATFGVRYTVDEKDVVERYRRFSFANPFGTATGIGFDDGVVDITSLGGQPGTWTPADGVPPPPGVVPDEFG